MKVTKRSAMVRCRMMMLIRVFLLRDVTKVRKTVMLPRAERTNRMTMATTEGKIREMYVAETIAAAPASPASATAAAEVSFKLLLPLLPPIKLLLLLLPLYAKNRSKGVVAVVVVEVAEDST